MPSKITIRDVAREAAVSIQTVSNVLNRRPGVAIETRRRVREVAQQLGYRPSWPARSLRRGRSQVLGLLLANIANPYFAEVARGAEDAARARGYSLILGSTDNDPERIRSLLEVLREHWVAGVVAATGVVNDAHLDIFEEFAKDIPLVQLARSDASRHFPRVVVDDARGGYVAAAHLLSLGRRSVAIITGPLNTWPGVRRLDGYRKARADWGYADDPRLIVEGDFTFQSGADGVTTLLDRGVVPDGIVAGNDLTAIGSICRLRERGFRIPDDVAIIGYDDAEVGRFYDPPISTIAQPKYELGHRGVTLLIDQLEAAERDPEAPRPSVQDNLLDCTLLVRRSSLGCPGEINCGSIFDQAPWEKCLAATICPLGSVARRFLGDERR